MRQTVLDKAIQQLQGEIDVLQLAIAKLKGAALAKAPTRRRPRAVAQPIEKTAS